MLTKGDWMEKEIVLKSKIRISCNICKTNDVYVRLLSDPVSALEVVPLQQLWPRHMSGFFEFARTMRKVCNITTN